ncbi:MAG: hypothetical protein ACJ71T_09100 [Actinomycetales bacterium]
MPMSNLAWPVTTQVTGADPLGGGTAYRSATRPVEGPHAGR